MLEKFDAPNSPAGSTPVELSLDALDQVVGGVATAPRTQAEEDAAVLAVAQATAAQVATYTAEQIDSFSAGQVSALGNKTSSLNAQAIASLDPESVTLPR